VPYLLSGEGGSCTERREAEEARKTQVAKALGQRTSLGWRPNDRA
jgi:hypothetical protein